MQAAIVNTAFRKTVIYILRTKQVYPSTSSLAVADLTLNGVTICNDTNPASHAYFGGALRHAPVQE